MKKMHLFRLLFCAMLVSAVSVFTGCKDDPDGGGDVLNPTLAVTPTSLTFDENGGAKTFTIESNSKWTITGGENATWLAVTPARSGNGNQTITVTTSASTVKNSVDLKVTVYAIYEGLEKEADTKIVKIAQTPGGVVEDKLYYLETFGAAAPSSSPYPFVDQYTDYTKTGEGSSEVTVTGTGASLRQSGKLSAGYTDASGKAKLFFGTNGTATINKIKIDGALNLRLGFGGSYSKKVGDNYENAFVADKFHVALSADGTTWSDHVAYTFAQADEYWVYVTSDFTLSKAVDYLYVKYTPDEASVFAIDDVRLTSGVGGATVNLDGGSVEPGESEPITIPAIIAKLTAEQVVLDAAKDRTFEAVVVSDLVGGNVNANNLQVMTPGATTGNNGITLYGSGKYTDPRNAEFTFAKGDKVKVTLKAGKARIVNFQGLYEVTGSQGEEWVVVEKIGTATISPIVITPDKLAEYQGMVVTVNNAKAPATAAIWCATDKFGVHTFTVNGTDMSVFTQANMPELVGLSFTAGSTGSISGYASVNKTIAQICPQNAADVAAFMGEVPSEPMIVAVTPATLSFTATGESKTTTLTLRNNENCTLSLTPTAPFTATLGENNVVTVTAPANATAGVINGTLTIKLLKTGDVVADTKTVTLTQAAPGAVEAGYESMASFLVATDSSPLAYYTISPKGENSIANGEVATGVKLGTGSLAGAFTSSAVGVTGNKTLSFYGVAWKAKSATLYIRVNGGGSVTGTASTALVANEGATGNPPFLALNVSESDHYTFNLEGLTAASTITFSTSADFTAAADKNSGRAVLCGIQLK